jgi:hypothetical protein
MQKKQAYLLTTWEKLSVLLLILIILGGLALYLPAVPPPVQASVPYPHYISRYAPPGQCGFNPC